METWYFELPPLRSSLFAKRDNILPRTGKTVPLNEEGRATMLRREFELTPTRDTNAYINGVKQCLWPSFDSRLWQRNYYEHIIRNQQSYEEIVA